MAEKPQKAKTTNMKIRRLAESVIMICLAGIMVVSGIRVYTILKNYKADRDVYDKIADAVGDIDAGVDFDALSKINPDVVGWLVYDDTPINYPVVQGKDNEMYLSMLFDRTWGGCGTLFVDAVTEAPFKQFNTIIYGHHMKDGSMFASIKSLRDQEWAADHPKLKLYTPDGDYYLEVWAFLNQPSDSDLYTTNFHNTDQQAEYLEFIQSRAAYTTDVSVSPEDKIVLLSNCVAAEGSARYIAVCKMVPMQ